ncbi:hypothetical protein A8C56_02690 [Niabella ginsenosidivorans]|uniref:Prepilin-type N-terminal cleavage/methylation domain-containing protein n=1 Tax=Niabella ginsenosidivorans TaxID=1176587 RepID=A0A1A9HZY5_9BACT|nr:hypothetical protein [Niabella ginsenosidivorans]ANH80031.1 hypothetical protein A8C56_02690 [Niabella ginsenosidivorans]
MARLNIPYQLKAFSLIESVITLVLILVVFFITMQFFVSLNASGFSLQKQKAGNVLDDYLQASLTHRDFNTQKTMVDGWPVTRETTPYRNIDGISQVVFTIFKRDSANTPLITRLLLINTQTFRDSLTDAQP